MARYNVKPKVLKKCLKCDKQILVKPCLKDRKKFCGNKCRYESMKGKPVFKGKTHSPETRLILSQKQKGKPAWNKGLKRYRAGTPHPWMSVIRGESHWSWRGGKSRGKHCCNTLEYRTWRQDVFKRDDYKCRIKNEKCDGQLQAHHILRWADYPELRYNVNNGIVLCQAHHPRKKSEETRLSPYFLYLISVSK